MTMLEPCTTFVSGCQWKKLDGLKKLEQLIRCTQLYLETPHLDLALPIIFYNSFLSLKGNKSFLKKNDILPGKRSISASNIFRLPQIALSFGPGQLLPRHGFTNR